MQITTLALWDKVKLVYPDKNPDENLDLRCAFLYNTDAS